LLLLTDWHTDHLYANERDTAINRPYRGTLVPEPWYGRDARVRSIMLEVNRKRARRKNLVPQAIQRC
jgi:N-formylglutamate amidohydrolase